MFMLFVNQCKTFVFNMEICAGTHFYQFYVTVIDADGVTDGHVLHFRREMYEPRYLTTNNVNILGFFMFSLVSAMDYIYGV